MSFFYVLVFRQFLALSQKKLVSSRRNLILKIKTINNLRPSAGFDYVVLLYPGYFSIFVSLSISNTAERKHFFLIQRKLLAEIMEL